MSQLKLPTISLPGHSWRINSTTHRIPLLSSPLTHVRMSIYALWMSLLQEGHVSLGRGFPGINMKGPPVLKEARLSVHHEPYEVLALMKILRRSRKHKGLKRTNFCRPSCQHFWQNKIKSCFSSSSSAIVPVSGEFWRTSAIFPD